MDRTPKKLFQVKLDPNIKHAIDLLSVNRKQSMQSYLNDFLKDFLMLHAQNIGNEHLINEIKSVLDSVPYENK